MTTKGRQDATARRVWEQFRRRWVMSLDRSRDQLGIITRHLLEDLLEKVDEIHESLSVLQKMGAYSECIVVQKLQDGDFKQDLEAARGRVLEARGGDENTFDKFAPLITWNLSDARWDLVADTDDSRTYVRAVREVIADLCAKYSLNEGWRLWLYHYLESGPGNGGVKLYSVKPVTDRFGGRYIEAKYYFPLSRVMLKEIAFEIEFTEVDAFGEYYGQIEGGGALPKPDYDQYFERWIQSDFNPEVKKALLKEFLVPLEQEFIADFKKTHGGKPQKRLIREHLKLPRRRFHQAMYNRKQKYK